MRGVEREKADLMCDLAMKVGAAYQEARTAILAEHWPIETEYQRQELIAACDALAKVIDEHWDRMTF